MKNEQCEISLNGTVCGFSLDNISIEKEDIISINEYIMVKNNIKQCLGYLIKCLSYY